MLKFMLFFVALAFFFLTRARVSMRDRANLENETARGANEKPAEPATFQRKTQIRHKNFWARPLYIFTNIILEHPFHSISLDYSILSAGALFCVQPSNFILAPEPAHNSDKRHARKL